MAAQGEFSDYDSSVSMPSTYLISNLNQVRKDLLQNVLKGEYDHGFVLKKGQTLQSKQAALTEEFKSYF